MLSSHCTKNPPTLSSTSTGAGFTQEIGGLQAYVTGDQESKLAILLISDIYGADTPIFRKIADKVGASGFLVVVPDFFYGDAYNPEKHASVESWFLVHNPDKGYEDAQAVIAALKSKGVSKVGAAGFCWGGPVSVRLAALDCTEAEVILHPGPITEEEIKEVKTPTAILGAEIDELAPPEDLIHLGEILSANKVDSYVKIYPGTEHGWTIRYDEDDELAVKRAEEAHEDMLKWLSKYVK